jgi:hypothetical protein
MVSWDKVDMNVVRWGRLMRSVGRIRPNDESKMLGLLAWRGDRIEGNDEGVRGPV